MVQTARCETKKNQRAARLPAWRFLLLTFTFMRWRRSSFLLVPSMFVKVLILLILRAIPSVNVDSWFWMYSKNVVDSGDHLPCLIMVLSL